MTIAATLGFPRIGAHRELKTATEAYWKGTLSPQAYLAEAARIRAANWAAQRDAGLDVIPAGDFSLYDHVLDTCCLVGAVPERFGPLAGEVPLDTYFRMARGDDGVPALEMTKWFDTNYHYLVPELHGGQTFRPDAGAILEAVAAARAQGIEPRPVLLGPVTFLLLSKTTDGSRALDLLPGLIAVYSAVLQDLATAGVGWVQIDEPGLILDLDEQAKAGFLTAYASLAAAAAIPRILVATYFGSLGDNLDLALQLPIQGLHFDAVRGASDLAELRGRFPADRVLSLGLVDGRNIWRTDLRSALDAAHGVAAWHPAERLHIAPSCSLLHCPVDLVHEHGLDPEIRDWLAFAVQKCVEVRALAIGCDHGAEAIADRLAASDRACATRATSSWTRNEAVRARCRESCDADLRRDRTYGERAAVQAERLRLPPFPTTTIGSFPQTVELRRRRRAFKDGRIDRATYETFLEGEIRRCLAYQERVGLDVLVHGEFERNDMVEYFGEQLDGFLFTANGWVQSYGTRCVKPPIIIGDVARPRPMTVRWSRYAQDQTERPVKGMLTGPVTILNWSFVRDDLPRSEVCRQIAWALRDEVADLEAAGIGIIQLDEAALREGLPLRRADWAGYLRWAVDCFRLASAVAAPATQIHTHMCYSEFNDIITSIAEMDADVITIETSRSHMELLTAFETFAYPNAIGPGVYDIHSPAIPSRGQIHDLLRRARRVLPAERVWVNPDCGLKTRAWAEVEPALANMVAAAGDIRRELAAAVT